MGGNAVTSSEVKTHYETHNYSSAKTATEIFKQTSIASKLDPHYLKKGNHNTGMRESCDSQGCPNSMAIAFGFDVTGSMGKIPFYFIQKGFPQFIKSTYNGALGYDAQILFAAIGDSYTDDAPLQVSQFEADLRMLDQLEDFYIERGGGGNHGESYELPWYFLANHTSIDCYNKRGQKGIYISIGDDKPHGDRRNFERIYKTEIIKSFGKDESFEKDTLEVTEIRDMALQRWNLFHICISEFGYPWDYGSDPGAVERAWHTLLGNHVVVLPKHEYIADTMSTILRLQSGMDKHDALKMIENENARSCLRSAFASFEIYGAEEKPNPETQGDGIQYI